MGVKDIKVAFIGAGNIAKEHIKSFTKIPGVILAGIYSRTRDKCETMAAEFGIGGVYDSIADLYDKTKADIVVITVSVAAIEKTAAEAAAYPWVLFLEKPAALSVAGARELIKVIEKNNRTAYAAMNRRFLGSTFTTAEALAKEPGKRFIYVQDEQPLARILKIHSHPPEVAAKWMYANSIHLIDYFTLLGRGNVSDVKVLEPWKGVEDTFSVIAHISFDSGDTGIYECQWQSTGPWAVTVSTGNSRFEMKPLESTRYQVIGHRKWTEAPQDPIDADFKPGFRRQAMGVINAARGLPSTALRLQDVMPTFELIEKIYGV